MQHQSKVQKLCLCLCSSRWYSDSASDSCSNTDTIFYMEHCNFSPLRSALGSRRSWCGT